LELRICDLVVDPVALLAITALLEARLLQMMALPSLDPLTLSELSSEELVALTDANETAAAKQSLDAELRHWKDGSPILARDWIEQLYQEVWPIAKQQGFSCFLPPVKKILRDGNEAQRWLKSYNQGMTIRQIMQQGIQDTLALEVALQDAICQPLVA
jgi:predicted glutamate--cysteine ligase